MKNILISIIIGVLTLSCEKKTKAAEVKPIEQIEVAVITTQYGDMAVSYTHLTLPTKA